MGTKPENQSCGITCAQTAIIPTNSVSDVSAAASSTNTFSMTVSFGTYEEHCSIFVPWSQACPQRVPEPSAGPVPSFVNETLMPPDVLALRWPHDVIRPAEPPLHRNALPAYPLSHLTSAIRHERELTCDRNIGLALPEHESRKAGGDRRWRFKCDRHWLRPWFWAPLRFSPARRPKPASGPSA